MAEFVCVDLSAVNPAYLNDAVPLGWQAEATGTMQQIVVGYLLGNDTQAVLTFIFRYVRYFVNAPCWMEHEGQLEALRGDLVMMDPLVVTREQIQALLSRAAVLMIFPI